MGFFSSNKKSTTEQTVTPNVPEWYKQFLESNMGRAEDVANRSAEDAIAGFTPDQQASFDLLRKNVGVGSDPMQQAIGALSSSLGSTSSDYKKFMNPYTENVLDTNTRRLVEQGDAQKQDLMGRAGMMNAFGGGRSDLMLSQADKNLNQNISDTNYKGLSDAFTWANEMALKDKSQTLSTSQGIGNLVGAQQNYNLADVNALNAAGTRQQQLAQAEKDLPQSQTSWFQGLLNQMPTNVYGTTTKDTTSTPGAGWGSQLLSAGVAAAGLMSGNPMLMAGGMGSLFGGGGGQTTAATPSLSPVGNDQMAMMMGSAGLKPFADGGPVQGYAEGGAAVPSWAKSLGNWADNRLQETEKNGSLLGNLLSGKYRVQEPTNRLESIMSAPAKSIAGALMSPKIVLDAAAEKAGGLKDYFTQPYAEQDAAKALQEAQAKKQAEMDDALRAKMEADTPSVQPPEQVPQTPVQEAVKTAIEPVIAQTQAASQGDQQSQLLDMLKQQLQGNKGETKGGINVPLVVAGMAGLASDKPFAQAMGEAGLAGIGQYAKERDTKQARQDKADESLKAMITELEKARVDQDYKNKSLGIRQQTADAYKTQVETKANEDKQLKEQIKVLSKRRSDTATAMSAALDPKVQLQYRNELAQIDAQLNELVNLGGVAGSAQNDVQSVDNLIKDWDSM